MTRRRLGWMTLIFWFFAAIELDELISLPGRIARHHAGFLAPWAEYVGFGGALFAVVVFTILWFRANNMQSMKKTGQVNVS